MAMAMVVMKGHPGSGKSTLARSLAAALSWPLIDKDDIRDSTRSLQETLILLHCRCSPSMADDDDQRLKLLNSMAYEAMWRVAETQLSIGLSVIVDSPLSRPSLLRSALAIAQRHGARLLVVECVASDASIWRSRLESRSSSDSSSWHKPSTWEELQNLLHSYRRCWDYPFPVGDTEEAADKDLGTSAAAARKLVVDTTSADLPQLRDAVLHWIATISNETPVLSFVAAPAVKKDESSASAAQAS